MNDTETTVIDPPELLGQSVKMMPFRERPVPDGGTLTGQDIADAVSAGRPWMYLRFTDGAMFSMCGGHPHRRRNADGSYYYAETCGVELRKVFNESYQWIDGGAPIVVEIPACWQQWQAVRDAVDNMTSTQRAATVVGPVLTAAVVDGSIIQAFDAIRRASGPKIWVTKEEDAPVVDALGMDLVVARRPDAWHDRDGLCRSMIDRTGSEFAITVTTIGLPSRWLQWRSWNQRSVSLDFGSVADAMTNNMVRRYIRHNRARKTRRRFVRWSNTPNR